MGWVAWLASGALAATDAPLTLLWSAAPDQAGAWYGFSVSGAGDVNGDGFDDVIVGAQNADDGDAFEGLAYVYYGSSTGPAQVPSWTADVDQAYAKFGGSVAAAGDVNNDGYDDVIVGAREQDGGFENEGQAHVFLGSATGLASLPIWSVGPGQETAGFGTSVASAGDVNGDDYDDVIVGAELYDGGQSEEGRAYVFHGGAGGVAAVAAWTAEADDPDTYDGFAVASAGDINDDGYDDVIVGGFSYTRGQDNEGYARVFLGSPTGLDDDQLWTAEGAQASASFGYSVSAADVNGDGFSDVIVGADGADAPEAEEGKVSVYHGSAWGLSTNADWTAESDQVGALLGHDVSSAGDVNGDGYDDVIVGAVWFDDGEDNEGGAFVYLGSEEGLTDTPTTLQSDQEEAQFGASVSSAGDVNGDGYDDVIVGAYQYDDGEDDEGMAFVFAGASTGPSDDADGDGVERTLDCDDEDATVYPGAPELCDGKDNACAGEPPAEDADVDADGVATCGGDCDDDDGGIFPGADEVCDGADSNCDGAFDADDVDGDGDAWAVCLGDCDDADPDVSPAKVEVCGDGFDNNCDGAVDEVCEEQDCSCDGSGAAAGLPALLIALLALRRRRYRTSAA